MKRKEILEIAIMLIATLLLIFVCNMTEELDIFNPYWRSPRILGLFSFTREFHILLWRTIFRR